MNLGNLLKQAGGTPLTGREVVIRLLCKDRVGNPISKTAKALILPIGEGERVSAAAAARAYVESHPEHAGTLQQELRLQQLALILHDVDNPRVKFVRAEDFDAFRSGITYAQVEWLLAQYADHLKLEYPELTNEDDTKRVGEQAADFSGPAPGPPSGS